MEIVKTNSNSTGAKKMKAYTNLGLLMICICIASCSAYEEAGTRIGHKYRSDHKDNIQESTLLYSLEQSGVPGHNPAARGQFITTKICRNEKPLSPAGTTIFMGINFKNDDEKQADKALAIHYSNQSLTSGSATYKHATSFTPEHHWYEFVAPTSVTDQVDKIVYSEMVTGPISIGDSIKLDFPVGSTEPGFQRTKAMQSVGFKSGYFKDLGSDVIYVKKGGESSGTSAALAIRYDTANTDKDGTTTIGVKIYAPDGRTLPSVIKWLDSGRRSKTVSQANAEISEQDKPTLVSDESVSVKFSSGETLIVPLIHNGDRSEFGLVRLKGFTSNAADEAVFQIRRVAFSK